MRRDEAYLLDILIASRKALSFIENINGDEFSQDELIQDAVLRNLEIIGEAARKVSPQFQTSHPEIPWKEMIGLRNRIVHEYFQINLAAVWEILEFRHSYLN